MFSARAHLHSDRDHPAHGHIVVVDADADGVPVEHVSVALIHGVPVARRRNDPRSQRLVEGQERTLFLRDSPAEDGVWVFRDSGTWMNASPPVLRPPWDPQIPT